MLHDYIIATYGVQLHCPIQVSSSVSQAVTHRLYRVLETIRENQLNFCVEASATKKGVLAFFFIKTCTVTCLYAIWFVSFWPEN